METLIKVGRHPNIVSLVGACTFEGTTKNNIWITVFTRKSGAALINIIFEADIYLWGTIIQGWWLKNLMISRKFLILISCNI